MSLQIEHIDAIARRKKRAMLCLEPPLRQFGKWSNDAYRNDPERSIVLIRFDAAGVRCTACGPFADPHIMVPCPGQVSIEMPCHESLSEYCERRGHFEHPGGRTRHEGVRFHVTSLDQTMENAEPDDPCFCECRAEEV